MTWAKLDDGFDNNPKLLSVSKDARLLYVCLITWARRNQTAGYVSLAQAMSVARGQGITRRCVDELTIVPDGYEKGLLELVRSERYLIHDYEDPNPLTSKERMRRHRQRLAERGLDGGRWEGLRAQAFKRDGYRCRYCGASPDPSLLIADHVIPAPEGPDTFDNVVTACRSCNGRKGARTPTEAGMELLAIPSRDGVTPRHGDASQPDAVTLAHSARGLRTPARMDPEPVPVPVGEQRDQELSLEVQGHLSAPNGGPPVPTPRQRVFQAWQHSTGKLRAKLDGKRAGLIDRALKAYPEEDLVDAVRGWRHSPHHRGENDRATIYNDLDVLLRDAKHIEEFRDLERQGSTGRVVAKSQSQRLGDSFRQRAAALREQGS